LWVNKVSPQTPLKESSVENTGPVLENGCWSRRTNFKIYKLYDKYDIVKFIKVGRLRLGLTCDEDGRK
jgi:hypothetical protein